MDCGSHAAAARSPGRAGLGPFGPNLDGMSLAAVADAHPDACTAFLVAWAEARRTRRGDGDSS